MKLALGVFTHLVAASVGFWVAELSRHHMLHAPVRNRPGFVLIEGRLHP